MNATGGRQNKLTDEIYDVSGNEWLGTGNGMRWLTRGCKASRAVALMKDGSIKHFNGATRALKTAREVGVVFVPDMKNGKEREFVELVSMIRFDSAAKLSNDAVYKSLAIGESFVTMRRGKAEVVEKVQGLDGKHSHYPHRKSGDEPGQTTSFIGSPHGLVLMDLQAYERWTRSVEIAVSAAVRDGHCDDANEYEQSVGSINEQLLRLSRVLGPKALALPYHTKAGQASITIGGYTVRFITDAADMMAVRIEYGTKIVSEMDGLVSVAMEVGDANMLGMRELYCELQCVGYQEWLARNTHRTKMERNDVVVGGEADATMEVDEEETVSA